jgi:ribosomal protein S18 acetylase RimI-like enzyme
METRDLLPTGALLHDHAMVRTLTTAFHDDPVFRWIFPDPVRRRCVVPTLFAVLTDLIGRFGWNRSTADGRGVALWVPPGEHVVDEDDAEAVGAQLEALAGCDAERLLTCMEMLEERHPQEASWHLSFLAVDPSAQGRGLGSELLAETLDLADADSFPAYLEATTPRSRALYERHGFELLDEIAMPDGPTLFAMWREPRF